MAVIAVGSTYYQWIAILLLLMFISPTLPASSQHLEIAYLSQVIEAPPALSNLDPFISDKGIQGARLAIKDNNTTGQFTQQSFALKETYVPMGGDAVAAFRALVTAGYKLILLQLEPDQLQQINRLPEAQAVLMFDVTGRDDQLRNVFCSTNMLHMLPSRAMRADALAQYMAKKRWNRWFLAIGAHKRDQLFAHALKRAAKKFGLEIVAEKNWADTHDARRTAQSEVPAFTQDVEYDVLMVADENGLFGEYLSYRTWTPRPVAGTQGLIPVAWHRTHEQWGAVQLQNRFQKQTQRWMTEEDYGAWLAVRAIGESATRTASIDMGTIKSYLNSDAFALAGFKGKKLSFRRWNGQLRQPVLLAAARSMVAVAPIPGFLHQKNELDTLGYDELQAGCKAGLENINPSNLPDESRIKQDTQSDQQGWFHRLINDISEFLSTEPITDTR